MCDFRFALSTTALLLLLRPRCILRPSEMEKNQLPSWHDAASFEASFRLLFSSWGCGLIPLKNAGQDFWLVNRLLTELRVLLPSILDMVSERNGGSNCGSKPSPYQIAHCLKTGLVTRSPIFCQYPPSAKCPSIYSKSVLILVKYQIWMEKVRHKKSQKN